MTDDGFFTICTTCTSRLKVRDTAAVGQIFACPKCGSMVMVEAPEGMEVEASEPVEQIAANESPTSLEPFDWNAAASSTNTSLLAIGMGTVAAILIAGSIGAYAWSNRSTEPTNQPVAESSSQPDLIDATEEPLNVAEVYDAAGTNDVTERDGSTTPQPTTPPEPAQLVTDDVPVDEIFEQVEATTPTPVTEPTNSIASLTPSTPSLTPAATDVSPEVTAATLSNLTRLLSGEAETDTTTVDAAPIPNPIDSEPESITEVASTTLANRAVQPETSSAPVSSAAKKLKSHIRAVRFEDVPLHDFVRTMMQLSGVAIQIDPNALAQTGQQPGVTVSVAAIDQPILSILRRALEPRKLTPVVEGEIVRITSPRLEDTGHVSTSFFVGDLLGNNANDLDLAQVVSKMVWPNSWDTAGGNGHIEVKGDKLNVSNTRLATINTIVLLEKLRSARGLKSRKPVPKHLLNSESLWTQIERYLRQRINMNAWNETAWTDVLDELEAESGLRLLVDWQSLATIGIHTGSTATLHARERAASEVFAHFLDSSDMTVIPIDGKTLQLTTHAAASSRPYLEFYSRKQFGDAGMAKVEQLVQSVNAVLDVASDAILVNADSATHRDLASK